jgi:hypothetical protein
MAVQLLMHNLSTQGAGLYRISTHPMGANCGSQTCGESPNDMHAAAGGCASLCINKMAHRCVLFQGLLWSTAALHWHPEHRYSQLQQCD